LSGNTAIEAIFGVIARSEALAVLRIDLAVAIVIDAIAASVDFTLAGCDGAEITATAGLWIAGLAASAEVIVGGGLAGVGGCVARVSGAGDAIVANGWCTSLAAIGSASFDAVTECAVVALEVLRQIRASAVRFITLVERAGNAVIAVDIRWVGATGIDVAKLDAVTRKTVVANIVVRGVHTGARLRIARIDGAKHAVVAIRRIAGNAEDAIAGFRAVASITIVTLRIHRARGGGRATTERWDAVLPGRTKCRIGRRRAASVGFGAAFDRTGDIVAVRTLDGITRHTSRSDRTRDTARFDAIASYAVVAHVVVGHETARIIRFVASIGRTRTVVITNDGATRLATDVRITRLDAIAIQSVAASRIVCDVIAAIIGFIAAIRSASDVVGAIDRRTRLATQHLVACLDAVAEQAVRAEVVILDVRTRVQLQIAEVVGARNVVITIERRAVHAAKHRIANFDAVAGDTIAAKSIVCRIRTTISGFVAIVHRTGNAVVTWRTRRLSTASSHCAYSGITRFRAIAIQAVITRGIVGSIRANAHRANIDGTGKTIIAIGVHQAAIDGATCSAHSARTGRHSRTRRTRHSRTRRTRHSNATTSGNSARRSPHSTNTTRTTGTR